MKLSLCMVKADTQRQSLREFEAILRTFWKIDVLECGRDPRRKVERSDFKRGVLGGRSPLVLDAILNGPHSNV